MANNLGNPPVLNKKSPYYWLLLLFLGFFLGQLAAYIFDIQIASSNIVHSALLSFYLISICFLSFCRYQKEKHPAAKLLYLVLYLAFIFFLIAQLIQQITAITDSAPLLLDLVNLAGYLLLVAALQINPLSTSENKQLISANTVQGLATLIFILGFFSYFVLIPQQYSSSQYATPFAFNTIITAYLLTQSFQYKNNGLALHWKKRYLFISLSFTSSLSYNLLHWLDVDINNTYPAINQVHLLSLFFMVIALLPTNKDVDKKLSKTPIKANNQMILLAASLPLIHLVGVSLNLFSSQSLLPRNITLLIWLCIFFSLIYREYREKNKNLNSSLANQKEQLETIQNLEQRLNEKAKPHYTSQILTALNIPVLLINSTGEIFFTNNQAKQYLSSSSKNLDSIISSTNKCSQLFEQYKYHQLSVTSQQTFQTEITIKAESSNDLAMLISILSAENIAPDRYIITLFDISKYKAAEHTAIETKDKFIANISHEFRTPLTIIGGVISELLLKPEEQEKQFLAIAQRNVEKMVTMVDQLLELSQLSHLKQAETNAQNVSLQVQEVISHFSALAQQQQLTFNHHITPNLWAKVSHDAIDKIITNLLANAFKYGGDCIVFSLTEENSHLIIEVSDNGVGLTEQQQQQIFERYYQAKSGSKASSYGVGIGLSLVSELLASHKWLLKINSIAHTKTSFTITIPAIEPVIANEDYLPTPAIIEPTSLPAETKPLPSAQVLIIEDNPDMQSYIHRVLNKQFNCLLASTGTSGIEQALNTIPDIIICDLMLPDIDGFDILETLKNNEITEHIPIIMLTARNDLNSKLEGLRRAADDYLTKPFNQQELLIRINNLLNLRQRLQQHHITQLAHNQKSAGNVEIVDPDPPLNLTASSQKFLDKLSSILIKNFAEDEFNINQLADQMAMSERQLQRKVKALLGITPKEYIKEYRLIRAEALLLEGSPIGTVALSCGFSSQTYFTRCFKEKYQMTPSSFIRQQQKT